MTVLVTGGAGFVGHAVVRSLAARGHAVRVLDPGAAHPLWPGGVDHRRLPLEDGLQQAAEGVDAVFHVAGVWDGGPGGAERMRLLNVEGTRSVLALGRPVVYTSSSITCGFGPWDRPGEEDEPSEDPRRPLRGTPKVYRETKLEAERLVAEAGGILVNPDYVVGPGDVHGVVTRGLLVASRFPVIPAPSGGKCFVGIDDVGEGHVLAWERGQPGRRYLLGAENRRYAEVLKTLSRMSGRRAVSVPLPVHVSRVLGRIPRLAATAGALEQMSLERYRSGRRAREELGWRPGSVDDAFRAMVR